MTARKCTQLWIVEAVWDGRVRGDERTAFERHLKTCRACQGETEILAQLRSDLRALPIAPPDPLSSRRQKQRLLADMDASTLAAVSEGRKGRARLIATVLAATLAIVLLLAQRRRSSPSTVERTTAEATIKITADPEARWRQTGSAGSHRVELEEGSFSLSISRPYPTIRVVIATPDGEIEDLGTVLRVEVKGDRTRAVAVSEGEVVVRLRGSPERRLQAGDSWEAPAQNPQSPDSVGTPAAKANRPLALSPSQTPTVLPRKRTRSEETKRPSAESKRERPAPVASSTEVATPASLESQAAEDKAYRDVLHLLHVGKDVEARDLAGDYLLRFPTGFRRIEMLDIAKGVSRQP